MTTHIFNLTLNENEASLISDALKMYEEDSLRKRYSDSENYEIHEMKANSAFEIRENLSHSAVIASYLHVRNNG